MIAAAARLARSRRAVSALAVAAVPVSALLALTPGGVSTAAARAGLAASALAAVAALVRRRARPAPAPHLAVIVREPLASDAGLAVVEAGGRRLLVGWARGGVSLVADLGAPPGVRP